MRAPKKKPLTDQPLTQQEPQPDLQIHLAPTAEARLDEARLAGASNPEAALPGWQSLGKAHKPTHPTGRQGPRERKVRW